MINDYTENPKNMSEIVPYIVMEKKEIVSEMYGSSKCYFYDTCSFRRHAQLENICAEYFLEYVKNQNGVIIITRCVLMELASHSGVLNEEYIRYIKQINDFGIRVLIIYEEDLFYVMETCYGSNLIINKYLSWAVRILKSPTSTITYMLEKNNFLNDIIIKGKETNNSEIYRSFFTEVRKSKQSEDNLGEELIGICLHILSHIPGEDDGKYSVITDDRGAAAKIDNMFKKTSKQYIENDIGIYSTPKLVQIMYNEKNLSNKEHMKLILNSGINGNIGILGMLVYDIRGREMSLEVEELIDLIMQPNGINIFF